MNHALTLHRLKCIARITQRPTVAPYPVRPVDLVPPLHCNVILETRLRFLTHCAEEDLVHSHIVWLVNDEGYGTSEGPSANGRVGIRRPSCSISPRFAATSRNFRRIRRNHCSPDIEGAELLAQPVRQRNDCPFVALRTALPACSPDSAEH